MNRRFCSSDFSDPIKTSDIVSSSKVTGLSFTFRTGSVKHTFTSIDSEKDHTLFSGTVIDCEGTDIVARPLFFPYLRYLPEPSDIATILDLKQGTVEGKTPSILPNKSPFYNVYVTKGFEQNIKKFEKEKYESPESGDLFLLGKRGQAIKFSKRGSLHIESEDSLLLIRSEPSQNKEREYPLRDNLKKQSGFKHVQTIEDAGTLSFDGKKMILLSTGKLFSISHGESVLFGNQGVIITGKSITASSEQHTVYCSQFKISKSPKGSTEPMVLGKKLKEFLEELIDKIAMLQYYHSCINPMIITALKQKIDTVLSKNCELH